MNRYRSQPRRIRPTAAFAIVGTLVAGSAWVGIAQSSATPNPDARRTYVLPGKSVFPEGVAVRGGFYYATSVGTGDIYRGDLTDRRASVFVQAGAGHRLSVGLKATANRLVVATSDGVIVVNRFTGQLVARFGGNLDETARPNDVTIAPNGDAYITDFFVSKIYRIPAAALQEHRVGVQDLPLFLDLAGTGYPVEQESANGLAATSDGRFLIVTHFTRGELYRIRLSDKQLIKIDLHGEVLTGPDGIILTEADVLYVVEYGISAVTEIRLSDFYNSGRVLSRTTNPRFQCPTTTGIAGDRLLVVNSQFCGPGEPPFTVSSIRIP